MQYLDEDDYEIYNDPQLEDGQFVIRFGPIGTPDENDFSSEEKQQLEELFQIWPTWDVFDEATKWAKTY